MFFAVIIVAIASTVAFGESTSVPALGRYRLEVSHGGKCITILIPACEEPKKCEVHLQTKIKGPGGHTISSSRGVYRTTPDNSSYVTCLYDIVDGTVNSSCCKYGSHDARGSRLEEYDYLELKTEICSGNASTGRLCVRENDWTTYVMPLKDLCRLRKPCRNFARCSAAPNEYNCSCPARLEGTNCDVPMDFMKINSTCLNTTASPLATMHNKTVVQCRFSCTSYQRDDCKSFEWRPTSPDLNEGVCVLRTADRNSPGQRVKTCNFDYFERKPPGPSDGGGVAMVTNGATLLVAILATIIVAAA